MAREITVVTPENVTITYELAGLGSRAIACILDVMLQMLALTALGLVLLGTVTLFSAKRESLILQTLSDFAVGIIIVALFLVIIGYFIFFEATRNGQTPGKKALGLRVVREEGGPVDASGAVIRNLVRVIELTLGFHLSSVLFILFSPKYKRLGDYAAGTIVVKEHRTSAEDIETPSIPVVEHTHAESVFVKDVDLLSVDEMAALRRFVERRHELKEDIQETLAQQIAGPIMSKLGVGEPSGQFSYANFLEEVHRRSVEERGLL